MGARRSEWVEIKIDNQKKKVYLSLCVNRLPNTRGTGIENIRSVDAPAKTWSNPSTDGIQAGGCDVFMRSSRFR